MTLTTWTQKAVVELLSKYLSKRLTGFQPRGEQLATELGITYNQLLGPLQGSLRLGVDVITIDRYRWRNPYTTKEPWTATWAALVNAGLGEPADGGWRVTPRGRGAIDRLTRDLRAYLESLPLPPLELRRATKALTELAAQIPRDSERAQGLRRGIALRDEARSDIVRLDLALQELSVRRDDAHIAAWQAAGYSGPVLDTLSQVWEGKASEDEVANSLDAKQERADVERRLDELVRRGDLTRDGTGLTLTPQGKERRDDIEADTDRRHFVGWPSGEALARLGGDLSAIVAALS